MIWFLDKKIKIFWTLCNIWAYYNSLYPTRLEAEFFFVPNDDDPNSMRRHAYHVTYRILALFSIFSWEECHMVYRQKGDREKTNTVPITELLTANCQRREGCRDITRRTSLFVASAHACLLYCFSADHTPTDAPFCFGALIFLFIPSFPHAWPNQPCLFYDSYVVGNRKTLDNLNLFVTE